MTPTVQIGDPVDVVRTASVRSGDAVLFSGASGEHDVLHRYLFKVPFVPYFVHRGDAVGAHVGLARCERIVGVAMLAPRPPSARDVRDGWILIVRLALRKLARLCLRLRPGR